MRLLHDKRWTLASIFILAFGVVWVWMSIVPSGSTPSGSIPVPQKGFLAPDFELSTLDGQTFALSDFRGKAVLVNFWATWCPPCRSEMPAMQQVFTDYDSDAFVILAINNTQQDRNDDVYVFVSEQRLTFPILMDIRGKVSQTYQVHSMPTSFFIDPEGIIREIVIGGPMSEALLRTRVNRLLEEQN